MIYAILIYRYKVNIVPLNKIKKERERPSIIKKGRPISCSDALSDLALPLSSDHASPAVRACSLCSKRRSRLLSVLPHHRLPTASFCPDTSCFPAHTHRLFFFLKCWRAHLSLPS